VFGNRGTEEEISDTPSWLSIGGNRATRFAFRLSIERGTARSISTEPVNRSSVPPVNPNLRLA
jgi:hypothetical protein